MSSLTDWCSPRGLWIRETRRCLPPRDTGGAPLYTTGCEGNGAPVSPTPRWKPGFYPRYSAPVRSRTSYDIRLLWRSRRSTRVAQSCRSFRSDWALGDFRLPWKSGEREARGTLGAFPGDMPCTGRPQESASLCCFRALQEIQTNVSYGFSHDRWFRGGGVCKWINFPILSQFEYFFLILEGQQNLPDEFCYMRKGFISGVHRCNMLTVNIAVGTEDVVCILGVIQWVARVGTLRVQWPAAVHARVWSRHHWLTVETTAAVCKNRVNGFIRVPHLVFCLF